MLKFVIAFAMVLVTAQAGLIGHGYGGYALSAAPIAVHAPISHATSYQNSNLLALHPTPVVAAHAPVIAAHAPLVAAVGIGHGGYYH